jgi:aspartate kinase
VHLIQNSAISFSICVDDKYGNMNRLYDELHGKFAVTFNENVSLYTVRHFTTASAEQLEKGKNVLLKQFSKETMQIVAKE